MAVTATLCQLVDVSSSSNPGHGSSVGVDATERPAATVATFAEMHEWELSHNLVEKREVDQGCS